MTTDHTWEGLHSSTNDMHVGKYRSLITGVAATAQRAVITSQVHFIMLLRLQGIRMQGKTVVQVGEPIEEYPDPNMS